MQRLLASLAIVVIFLSTTRIAIVQAVGYDGQEFKYSSASPGYAEFEDTDAATYPDANGQAATFVAPTNIANSPLATSVLNNVQTNVASFYLLQTGLVLQSSAGSVTWTDTTKGYVVQPYHNPDIPYYKSHRYQFLVTYTTNTWQMCVLDEDLPNNYSCVQEPNAPGTTLKAGVDTSVWLEAHNKTANWWYGFDAVQATEAMIFRNGVGQDWATQDRHTMDACSTSWPYQNAFSGSLVAGGSGYFGLSGVPFACPLFTTQLPDIKNSGNWSTYTFIRNNTANPGSATITYYDTAGNPVVTRGDIAISANGVLIDAAPSNFTGSAAVGAPQDSSVVTARAQTGPYVVDGYAGVAAPATTVLAPLVHRNNYGWYSDLLIMNTGSGSTNVTVAFQPVNVSGDTCSQTLSNVPAYGLVDLSTASSCISGTNPFVGSARISSQSSQPLAVVVTQWKDYTGDGRIDSLAEYDGIPSTSAVPTNWYPLLMQGNYNWGSSVTLQNNDPVNSSSGTLYLYSNASAGCGSSGYTIPSKSATGIYPLPLTCSTPYIGNGRAAFSRPLAGIVNFTHTPATDYSAASARAAITPTTSAVLPLVIRNAVFFNRAGWSSGLNIQNAGASTAHGDVFFYGSGGNLISAATQVFTVVPNGSATINPPSALGDGFIGSALVVSADQPIAVSATHVTTAVAGEDDAFAYTAFSR